MGRVFLFSAFMLSGPLWAAAWTPPLILSEGFTRTEYVGKWALARPTDPNYVATLEDLLIRPRPGELNGLEHLGIDPRDRLFTTSTVVGQDAQGRPQLSLIPDLQYPAQNKAGIQSFGLRLIPIPEQNVEAPLPQTYYLNPFLMKVFYNRDMALNAESHADDKSLYVITPHSDPADMYYGDFSQMTKRKIEVSTIHASAYTYIGGLSGTTRRNFGRDNNNGLSHSSMNNLYAISVRGVDQEAVNLNISLWSNLYYNNADGYPFAPDYKFDPVVNVNLHEVLAFAKGWLDHTWVRRDLNARIAQTLAQPGNAERYGERLRERGREKPGPFNPATHTYYDLLMREPALALYCHEGVATSNFLGLSVPLTLKYMQRIFGAAHGRKLFQNAAKQWSQIQVIKAVAAEGRDYWQMTPAEREPYAAQVLRLDSERIQNVLARMVPLWEKSFTRAKSYSPEHPLFPERDEAGRALGQPLSAAQSAVRDQELSEVSAKGLPYKVQTSSDILRALLEIYAPFHKVGAVRNAAVILTFVDKIKERTGLLFAPESPEYGFAHAAIKIIFKHEGNWVWAKIQSAPGQAQIREAVLAQNPDLVQNLPALATALAQASRQKYATYVTQTNLALEQVIHRVKNPEGEMTPAEIESFRAQRAGRTEEEILAELAELRRFRAERNLRLYNQVMGLKGDFVNGILATVPEAPLLTESHTPYPTDGLAAYTQMRSEILPVLEGANNLPVRQPDLIAQTIAGEKYVKYNVPPGIVHTLSLGVQELNPNVRYTVVGTLAMERLLVRQVPAAQSVPDREDYDVYRNWPEIDPHFQTLQNYFRDSGHVKNF